MQQAVAPSLRHMSNLWHMFLKVMRLVSDIPVILSGGYCGSFFGHWVHVIVYPFYLGDKNAGVPGGKMFLPRA